MLDEYLQDEQAEKKRAYEAWNLNKADGPRMEAPAREKEVIREVQEEEEEEKALRRVAHLWRKEERKMNKGPLEEGEISVEERKKVLFRRNGFVLDCLFWGEV